MNLDSLLQNLLSSGIKLSDPETLRKFRVLNTFQLIVVILAPFLGFLYFYVGAVLIFFALAAAGLLMIVSMALLRVTRNLVLGTHLAISILWAALLVVSWYSGAVSIEGVIKPTLILNAGLILLAVFLLGYPGGTVWATVVFMETGLFVYLYRSGYPFPDLLPLEAAPLFSLGGYLVALLVILLFAFLFERERSEALVREQAKSGALRESQRYMDDILSRSPTPIFILDRSHRVVHWNLACEELTGIRSGEILGKRVWDGLHANEKGSVADMILDHPEEIHDRYGDAVLSKTDTGWFELTLYFPKLKGGLQTVVTAAPLLDGNGVVRGAIQTIQEAGPPPGRAGTDNGATAALAADPMASAVFRVDAQGKITYWNESCAREFGYPSSEMVGKSVFTFVSKQYRPLFKETLIGALKGDSFTDRSFKYYGQEGKPVYVLAKVFPVDTAEGDGRECAVVNTNVTELRLRIKKLELYAAESKEKLKSVTEDYDLLKKNIATFIRKKEEPQP
ncbi:MAG: PAS domain S-box protein [Deltaproteobacteria bacterium]|nr:PAS domain S-box protein [Deltaproteobacteria bacterium]